MIMTRTRSQPDYTCAPATFTGGCCCPFHMAWALPMGMGAAPNPPPTSGPKPSFTDGTLKVLSSFASRDDAATRDLYDVMEPGQLLVIRGATVIPMRGEQRLPAHDVLVRDGRITAVEPTGSIRAEGARVIDATGLTLLPGFADVHTHPSIHSSGQMWASLLGNGATADDLTLPYDVLMLLYLAGGITRIQVMAGTPEYLALRDALRRGQFRGPQLRVASPVIDGYPAVWAPTITWQVSDAEGGRTAARRVREDGYDFAKPYTRLPYEAYVAFSAECNALGIERTGHIPAAVRVEEALFRGQRGIAHTFELFYNEPHESRANLELLSRRAKLCAELGVTVQTTFCVARAFEYDIGQIGPADYPLDDVLDPVTRWLMHPDSPFLKAFGQDPQMQYQGRDCIQHTLNMLRALHAEGVQLVTGTDIPNGNASGRHSMHDELEVLVKEVGMSAYDALRTATVNSAAHMGDAESGTIEPGQRAELVLLRGDPLADISATRQIECVVIGNALLTKQSIERGVARARSLYDAMPIPKREPHTQPSAELAGR
jgi:hypothetical protein